MRKNDELTKHSQQTQKEKRAVQVRVNIMAHKNEDLKKSVQC